MENYSRGNQQVQNSLYELSHGSDSSKTNRFRLIIQWIPILISAIFFSNKYLVYCMWTISMFLAIMFYAFERKIEPKTGNLQPYIAYSRTDLLCAIRNSHKHIEKKDI